MVDRACQKVELKPSLRPSLLSTEVRIPSGGHYGTAPELFFEKRQLISALEKLISYSPATAIEKPIHNDGLIGVVISHGEGNSWGEHLH
jgi:hypothetical protein